MKNSLIILGVTLLTFINTSGHCVTEKAALPKLTREVCREHINREEKSKGIEPGLLEAIAQIESKLSPLSVNASGRAHSFQTVNEAVCFIKRKQSEGCKNISVGPMQLHIPSHRRNFKSIEEMFDPHRNISYAAKLLNRLIQKTGSTEEAVKLYHSDKPYASENYKNRVFGAWAKIRKRKSSSDVREISAKLDKGADEKKISAKLGKKISKNKV